MPRRLAASAARGKSGGVVWTAGTHEKAAQTNKMN